MCSEVPNSFVVTVAAPALCLHDVKCLTSDLLLITF